MNTNHTRYTVVNKQTKKGLKPIIVDTLKRKEITSFEGEAANTEALESCHWLNHHFYNERFIIEPECDDALFYLVIDTEKNVILARGCDLLAARGIVKALYKSHEPKGFKKLLAILRNCLQF